MPFRDKQTKEKGISVIALIAAILLLGSIGYVMSSLMVGSQESTPRTLDSARAFYVAQGGVEYTGKYLQGVTNWGSVGNLTLNLGSGNFTVTFSPVDSSNIDATITGNFGSAHRLILVRYNRSGMAIASRGGISMGNNAALDCDPLNPSNPICNNTNLNTCPCTAQNVSASNMPPFSVPSPAPAVLTGGCTINSNRTIAAGVYYCSSGLTLNNNVQVTLSGAVTIFTTTFTVNNNAYFNNSGSPANLLILAQGTVNLYNNAVFKGAIYAPGYDILISNNVQFTGTVAGGRAGVPTSVNVNNNADFDQGAGSSASYFNLAGGGSGSAVSLTNWQE